MKQNTAEHILNIGTDLVLRHGFHQVGLQKILDRAGIPKGSFYYYFKSKEDFGLQLIDHYSNQVQEFLGSFLKNQSRDPRSRIFDLFEQVKASYQEEGFLKGCLLGNCSLELSALKNVFAQSIARNFDQWQAIFAETIREGQEKGNIKLHQSAEDYAAFILNSWEGALVRMKAIKNNQPLDVLIKILKDIL